MTELETIRRTVKIRPFHQGDARAVARRLRDQDRIEAFAATGSTDFEAIILASAEASQSRPVTGLIGGDPVCCFGCVPGRDAEGHFGSPWLLGTPALDRIGLRMTRDGRKIVRRWLAQHGRLMNHVDSRNTKAIAWLRLVGFDVCPLSEPIGPFRAPFHRFQMVA